MAYSNYTEQLQVLAKQLGYNVGVVDGKLGRKTYTGLVTALRDLEKYKLESQSVPTPIVEEPPAYVLQNFEYTETLRKNSKGDLVCQLQTLLVQWHMAPYMGETPIDGAFGKGTYNALKQFQVGMGLKPTGVADKPTWDLLNTTPLDISKWFTPQISVNPNDDGKLPFACNCNGAYCSSAENAKPGKTSVGLAILLVRIENEINWRYNRTDITVHLTDDMDTSRHDDRNGGNRCKVWNKRHSGATTSQHIYRCAADIFIVCPFVAGNKIPSISNLYDIANELNPYGGVGKYGSNIHVDTRMRRSRW